MVDTTRLAALLQLDDRGEYLVDMLSRALVDRRKRRQHLISLHEIDQDQVVQQQETITQSEAEALGIAVEARKPLTTAEVQERATSVSLRNHRQHASATLNNLTAKGLLGKVRGPGRQVYFAPAEEAVALALIHLGQQPENCDLEEIREITELPYGVALETVEGLRFPGG